MNPQALLAVLIANFSIAFISRAYKLADRILAHHTQLEELQRNYGIQADLLESYLGGVYRQYGKSYTLEFVQKLFRPLVIAAYNDRKMLWAKKVAAEAEEAAIKASKINLAESAALEDGDDDEPDPMRDFVSLLHQYGSRRKQKVTFVKVGLHKMVAKLGDEKAGSYSALEGHKRNWQHIKQLYVSFTLAVAAVDLTPFFLSHLTGLLRTPSCRLGSSSQMLRRRPSSPSPPTPRPLPLEICTPK